MAFVERGRSTEHLMGIGDRHEGDGWMAVCALDEIEPGRGVVRVVNGLDLAIMRDGDGSPDDAVHALGNLCPHRGGQLGDGKVVDGKAALTKVSLGVRRAAQVEVVEGLAEGDLVVTAGQLKLREGALVKTVGDGAPPAAAPVKPGVADK